MPGRPGRGVGPIRPPPRYEAAPESAAQPPPFLGESQREAAHAIRGALAGRHAFVALTGAPGLGKTAVLATAVASLPRLPLRTIRVGDPAQVSAELATRIERVASEPADPAPDGERHTVIVVDDAHAASPELLRCLARIAAAGGRPDPRAPQVVLAGRPALWDRLASQEFAPLAERITVRPVLRPLSDEDTRGLIRHLLDQPRRISGQMLTGDAEEEMLRLAQGRPERIGAIVRSALTLGDIEARPPISLDMVRSAATALDGARQGQGRGGPVSARTLALTLVAAGMVAGGVVLTTHGWPSGRVAAAALDLANRAVVPWRTPPAGGGEPTFADVARRPPVAPPRAAAAPPPAAAEAPPMVPAQAPPPVSPTTAGQDSADRPAVVGGDPLPRSRPPAPASSAGHDQPTAVASAGDPPTSAVPPPAAVGAPGAAGLPAPTTAEVPAPVPAPVAGAAAPPEAARMERATARVVSATRADPAEAARLLRLAEAMASIGQVDDAKEMLRASAALGDAQAGRLLSQSGGR